MSDPILISDEEDEATPPPFPSKRPRKNPTPTVFNLDTDTAPPGSASTPFLVDELPLTAVKCSLGSGARLSSHREDKFSGKRVISLESDSEDSPRPETSKKYEPIHADSLVQRCGLLSGSSDTDSDNSTSWMQGASFRSSLPNDAIEVDSDQEKEEESVEKIGRQKQTRSSKSTSISGKAMPKKQMSKDERIRATEETRLRKEQEKLQKAASKAEDAEHKKIEREMQKWQNGEALKSMSPRLMLNWLKDLLVILPRGPKIPYVILVYEAEDFCNLVANERLLENVSRVRDQYPSYTVCYLTNKLMSYVKKREGVEYKNHGNHSGWRKPPIDEVLANLTTHYIGVHSRNCVDEAEVAEHVVGLTSNLAYCQIRNKLSWLKVKADGVVASKDAVDKHLIKKSAWLKALVAIPKVQTRFAVAVWKKYPSMKSLLKVYMDPKKSEHEKEFLLKDLKLEGRLGEDIIRLGEVCSKRIYRVLMSHNGAIKI